MEFVASPENTLVGQETGASNWLYVPQEMRVFSL